MTIVPEENTACWATESGFKNKIGGHPNKGRLADRIKINKVEHIQSPYPGNLYRLLPFSLAMIASIFMVKELDESA
jgi:hypothetical protein